MKGNSFLKIIPPKAVSIEAKDREEQDEVIKLLKQMHGSDISVKLKAKGKEGSN